MNETFGTRLRKALERRKLTQTELAKRIGRTVHTVHRWCKGYSVPSATEAVEIGKILGVSVEYLVTGKDEVDMYAECKRRIINDLEAML